MRKLQRLIALFVLVLTAATCATAPQRYGGPVITPGLVSLGDAWTENQVHVQSVVHGDVSHPSWMIGSPNPPGACPVSGDTTAIGQRNGLRSLVAINSDGLSIKGAYLGRSLTAPAGTASVTLEWDEVQIPSGSTGPFALQLYDGRGAQLSTTSFTPTTTPTNVSTAAITVIPGTEYWVRIVTNVSGSQSTFVAGKFRVRPTGATGVFSTAFKRIELYASWQKNNETGWTVPEYPNVSSHAFVEFDMPGTTAAVEMWSSLIDYLGSSAAKILPTVDGFPLDPGLTPTASRAVSYVQMTVPSVPGNGLRNVRLPTGTGSLPDVRATVSFVRNTVPIAIYVPASTPVHLHAAPAIVDSFVGDSKTVSVFEPATNMVSIARALGRDVIVEAYAGRRVRDDTGLTLAVASCAPLAAKVAQQRPARIFWRDGRNDWGETAFAGLFTGDTLITQIGNCADAFHAAAPWATFVMGTWSTEVTENTVSGRAWDTERELYRAICASRSPWCVALDEARYWTTSNASSFTEADGIHPNQLGYEYIVRGQNALTFGTAWPWLPTQLSPTAWFESWPIGAIAGGQVGNAGGNITGAVDNGSGAIRITTQFGNGLTGTPVVTLASVGGCSGANGEWVATVTAGNKFDLIGSSSAGCTFTSGGTWTYDGLVAYTGAAQAPPLKVSGSPTTASHLIVEIRTGGARGTATYAVSNNGGTSYGWYGTTSASESLTGLGLTLLFPVGTYDVLQYWTTVATSSEETVATWKDMLGGSANLVQGDPYRPSIISAGLGGVPSVQYNAVTPTSLQITGISLAPPYTIGAVGKLVDQTGTRPLFGPTASNTAPTLYAASSTTMAANANGSTITATVNAATATHVYIVVVNGASSVLYVDGVATAGTLGAVTLTGLYLGYANTGPASGWGWDGQVGHIGIVPRAITPSEALAWTARERFYLKTNDTGPERLPLLAVASRAPRPRRRRRRPLLQLLPRLRRAGSNDNGARIAA